MIQDAHIVFQEAVILPPWIAFAVRSRPGVWDYIRVSLKELTVEKLTVSEYLRLQEELVNGR